ncbi:STAS domain-containing protein [Nonomuraea insulae]|uniref:Anti-sigma factor antagonist n=1 Tax=Nonomuraea insulae TaxID=1616787 RepID=A0ABW1CTT0_9ACTN
MTTTDFLPAKGKNLPSPDMIDARAGRAPGSEVMAMGEYEHGQVQIHGRIYGQSQWRSHGQGNRQGNRQGNGRGDELAIVVLWSSAVCPVIALRGELGAATAADLVREVERVLAGRPAAVVVDLSRLAFCDFEGIGALIGAHRRARQLGGELVLTGAQGRCARLLRRTGLDHVFPQLPGRTEGGARGMTDVGQTGGQRHPPQVIGT